MKKLLIIVCALFLGVWEAHSEVIETVGYNPTRYGQYKRLKVSSGVELPAGLVSPKAESQSGGSLTLEACQDGCTNPAYKIERLQANTVQGNSTNFEVEKVTANSGTITINNGGEISSAIGAGKVAVGQLDATTSNLVVGNSLKLGKGTIVAPSGRTDCQWVWETITHKDGTAKVLALKGCAGGTKPDPEPDPGSEQEPATCDQRDYLIAHKSECCPSESYSNTECYKEILRWKTTGETVSAGGDDCPRGAEAGPSSFECEKIGDTCGMERCASHDRQCTSIIYRCSSSGEYRQLW